MDKLVLALRFEVSVIVASSLSMRASMHYSIGLILCLNLNLRPTVCCARVVLGGNPVSGRDLVSKKGCSVRLVQAPLQHNRSSRFERPGETLGAVKTYSYALGRGTSYSAISSRTTRNAFAAKPCPDDRQSDSVMPPFQTYSDYSSFSSNFQPFSARGIGEHPSQEFTSQLPN